MQNPNEPQCDSNRLQIDSYLDGDLAAEQEQQFLAHCDGCADCGQELRIARRIFDGVESLPLLDCPASLLAALDREPEQLAQPNFIEALRQLLLSMPVFLRYSLPALLVLVMTLSLGGFEFSRQPEVAQEQYSVEEIRQALEDFNLAIGYLNAASQRTEVLIGDRFLITPLQDSVNASLQSIQDIRNRTTMDDPI